MQHKPPLFDIYQMRNPFTEVLSDVERVVSFRQSSTIRAAFERLD